MNTCPELLSRLRADHRHLTRVLLMLEQQIDALDGNGEKQDMALLFALVDYVEAYPDRWHHPAEDVLFEYLKNRNAALPCRTAVDRLLDEHTALIHLTRELFPLAEQCLTEDEWRHLAERTRPDPAPPFGDRQAEFAAMYDRLLEDAGMSAGS